MNHTTRRKVDDKLLWDFMAGRKVDTTLPLHIPHSGARQKRDTTIDVRFASVELKPPQRGKNFKPIPVWAVYVRESRLLATYPLNGCFDYRQGQYVQQRHQ